MDDWRNLQPRQIAARWATLLRMVLAPTSATAALCLAMMMVAASHAAAGPSVPHGKSIFETDVSNDPTRWEGEPFAYVNPVAPDNVVLGYTSVPQNLPPAPGFFTIVDFEVAHLAISSDRGNTWTDQPMPLQAPGKIKGDAFVGAGPDGTLYAGGMVLTPGPITGADRVITSTDQGKTWSAPTEAIGDEDPATLARFAPGQQPIIGPVAAVDRGWMTIDQSDGAIWVSGRADSPAIRRWMVVSHDKAKTWGTIYAFDSAGYPEINDGTFSAARGAIAAVYVAGSTPISGAACPCAVFETSTQDGNHLDRHVVPLADGVTEELENPGLVVAADPVHRGHYAVAVLNGAATAVEVYSTSDSGKTWSGPVIISETADFQHFKIWSSFSPQGFFGVMWRTMYADGSYDVWSALSRDGGEKFSSPLRVSTAVSPGYPQNYMFGDDASSIFLDRQFAHIGWGDSRTGNLEAWYGRVPLADFRGGGGRR